MPSKLQTYMQMAEADHRQLPGLDGLSHHRRKAVQIPLRRAGHDPRPASGRHRLRGVRLLERKDGSVCPQGFQGHRPHRQQRRKAEASVCVRRVGYGRQRVSKEPLSVGIPGGTRGRGTFFIVSTSIKVSRRIQGRILRRAQFPCHTADKQ